MNDFIETLDELIEAGVGFTTCALLAILVVIVAAACFCILLVAL